MSVKKSHLLFRNI